MGGTMADSLRLRVVLDMAERVLAPMKRIGGASGDTARALKAARDRLKELNEQQAAVGNVQKHAAELAQLNNALKVKQNLLAGMKASGTATAAQLQREERGVRKLSEAMEVQKAAAIKARGALNAMGVTGNLSAAQSRLRGEIEQTTAAVKQQKTAFDGLARQQRKLAELNEKHGKDMMRVGMVGAGGAAAMAAGSRIAAPLRSVVGAFMPAEDAQTQLRASMMQANGGVPAEYGQILELATRLGDRLPGTTADFIEMMTMLRRQGMSAKTILGGLGESAAYLGVQLRMPVTAAAEFAAKLQDATQTAEGDMMGLTDLIQRGFYLGVDSGNMLQGFTKMSPVLDVLGEKGLGAARKLAPLLVMMDQSGMAGESAGNAIRKVFQAGLDAKKLGKANAALKDAGAGFKLDFTNGKGEFGGIDKMFAQLDKLKALNSVQRVGVVKDLFGDDAETLQVLNTLMSKGMDGYREVDAKMQAQADLRKRVDEQLGTVSASIEAAQGSFTNMLKDMGATIAPDLVRLANALGKVASAVGAWVRENPELVKWALRVVGVLAVLVTGAGALALAYASVVGPFLLLRFALAKYSLALSAANAATKAAGPAMGLLSRVFALVRPAVMGAGRAILWLGRALLATPLGRVLSLLAFSATMVYNNWDGIKGGLVAIWDGITGRISEAISGGVGNWLALLLDFSPIGILYSVIAFALDALGIELPARFSTLGANLISGLVGGITSGLGWLKDTVVGVASSVAGWFAEKLGINSPSRVFMQYGGWVSEGAALGIAGGQGAVRNAALSMATAATLAMPMAADAAALRLDTRPPMAAHMAAQAGGSGGNTYTITINPAAGADPQAIARAVSAELDRRERSQQSRRLSALHDID